jgi:dihydrofolate reductase
MTVTVHMVASVDGFIAKKDNTLAWLETTDTYDKGVAGEDAAAFVKTIDCYVMGSRTYEHAVELSKHYGWAYGDTPTIVVTSRKLPAIKSNIELYSGDLTELDARLRRQYRNIWLVGGAVLVKDFIRQGLADDIRLMIAPVLLGDGTPFFDRVGRECALHVKDVKAYKNGFIELWYEIRRD